MIYLPIVELRERERESVCVCVSENSKFIGNKMRWVQRLESNDGQYLTSPFFSLLSTINVFSPLLHALIFRYYCTYLLWTSQG